MAEMGRPNHYSIEEIKNVIDDYVASTGGTVSLNASKIAEYAEKKLSLKDFKYYTINRNPEAKKYVEDLNKEISKGTEKKLTSAITTFTPIDVKAYLLMSPEKLGKALANLNVEREDMADSNTKLLKENLKLKDSLRTKDIEIKKLTDKVDETAKASAEIMEDLKRTIHEQREIINRLTQSVKLRDDTLHLLWDKEVEVILKRTGIFENDGIETNPKRIVTDIEASIVPVVKDANKIDSAEESGKVRFLDRLRKI